VTASGAADLGRGPITAQIQARLNGLTPSGRRVGETVLAGPLEIIHLTVTDLAERTGTSVATVVRFCQDVGLRGFMDLKIRLAAESIPPERGLHQDVDVDDEAGTVLEKVLRSTATAIHDAAGTLEHAMFARAVELLRGAGQVLFVGVGTSAPLAQDAAYRFRCAGLVSEAPYDPHVQHVTARLLGRDGVCVAVSHTGQTRETLAAVGAAGLAGAATIAITSFFRSPLTRLVDVALVAGCRETNFRVEAMASRIAHLTVLDALLVAVCLADPERARRTQQLSADVLTEHRM
jgi:DNA-binding MurR/RpiR family transcriptional regulator